jgi:regulator of sigma E protease
MEAVLITIGAFVAMLLVLVVIHELGHYITARAFGVKALEFGIGFPPRAFGFHTGRTLVLMDQDTQFINAEGAANLRPGQIIKVSSTEDANGNLVARVIEVPQSGGKRQGPQSLQELGKDEYLNHEGKVREVSGNSLVLADMLYSINYTPLGGFVRLAGESNPAVPRSLARQGTGPRAIILAAGSAMNAILPIFIFSIMFMLPHDVPVGNTGDLAVIGVVSGSPAEAAGVEPGDIIARANGREIQTSTALVEEINLSQDSPMEWVLQRNGQEIPVQVTPEYAQAQGQWLTGIQIALTNVPTERRSDPPWVAVPRAFSEMGTLLVALQQQVGMWTSGQANFANELAGPVGIAQITGEVTREFGLQGFLMVSILISINLAILNILPIPMLDGGRLVFVALEWVRRGKRVPPEKEGMVHLIGFVVLIGLIILITANDIQRLIQGGSLLGG